MDIVELVRFLSALKKHNNKPWFDENRPRYQALRGEFTEFVQNTIAGIGQFDPEVRDVRAEDCLFRINRDIRFSKDKTPYNTHFSAAIAPGGRKGQGPAYYFQIDWQGKLMQAGGVYMPPTPTLNRIRRFIASAPKRLERVIHEPKFVKSYGAFDTELKLQRPPVGFAADHPLIEHLKLKSFTVSREVAVKGKSATALRRALLAAFQDMHPFIEWLRDAVSD
ncbi:MAG: DUF2461 domain-containing protein [Anaerolineales bacterium]